MQIDALIADNGMRKRDEHFADQGKHKATPHPLHDKRAAKPASKFALKDFNHDPATNTAFARRGKRSTQTETTALQMAGCITSFVGLSVSAARVVYARSACTIIIAPRPGRSRSLPSIKPRHSNTRSG